MQRVIGQDRVFVFARAVANADVAEIKAQIKYFAVTPLPLSSLTWGLSHSKLSDCTLLHVAALTNNAELGAFVLGLTKENAQGARKKQSAAHLKVVTSKQSSDGSALPSLDQGLLPQLRFVHNLDVNAAASDGTRALHWAARAGHTEFGRMLLKHKANAHCVDCFGTTALHVAAFHNRVEFVKMLLREVDDSYAAATTFAPSTTAPNYSCPNRGSTPLHFACSSVRGNNDVVQELLAHPLCDPSVKDANGRVPLEIAQRNLEAEQLHVTNSLQVLEVEQAKLTASKKRLAGTKERLKEAQRDKKGEDDPRVVECEQEVDAAAADVKQGEQDLKRLKARIDDGKTNIAKLKGVIAVIINRTLVLERSQDRREMKYQTLFEQVGLSPAKLPGVLVVYVLCVCVLWH